MFRKTPEILVKQLVKVYHSNNIFLLIKELYHIHRLVKFIITNDVFMLLNKLYTYTFILQFIHLKCH